jgi:hypothetical protein
LEKVKEVKDEVEVVKKYKEDVEKYEHLKNKKLKSAKEDKVSIFFESKSRADKPINSIM